MNILNWLSKNKIEISDEQKVNLEEQLKGKKEEAINPPAENSVKEESTEPNYKNLYEEQLKANKVQGEEFTNYKSDQSQVLKVLENLRIVNQPAKVQFHQTYDEDEEINKEDIANIKKNPKLSSKL